MSLLTNLFAFTRPHTLYAAIITILCLYYSTESINGKPVGIYKLLNVTLMIILGSLYCVGLNQVFDVEIDKINKSYLPIASGKMSLETGIIATFISLFVGLYLAWCEFSNHLMPLFVLYIVGISIGTMYSLSAFKIRDYPLLSALFIAFDRGFALNFIVYCYFNDKVKFDSYINMVIIFVVIFGMVIGIFKDIPDVKGDKKYKRESFAILYGELITLLLCVLILIFNYFINFIYCILTAKHLSFFIIILWLLYFYITIKLLYKYYDYYKFTEVSKSDDEQSKKCFAFYMFTWKLFYLQYILFPFIYYYILN